MLVRRRKEIGLLRVVLLVGFDNDVISMVTSLISFIVMGRINEPPIIRLIVIGRMVRDGLIR